MFASAKCGLKKDDYDLAVVVSEPPSDVCGLYTKNKMAAAPVIYCKKYDGNKIKSLIINSKNANAATGKQGYKNIEIITKKLASHLECKKENVLMSSTGVIGEPLPVDKILFGMENALENLKPEENGAPHAIRTTDKYEKKAYKTLDLGDGKEAAFFAMAKGAGMLHPDMATMLVYIFTDLSIDKTAMKIAFKESVDKTLNRITVDGDTSTNDSAMFFANGALGNKPIKKTDKLYERLCQTLTEICLEMAKLIVSDGEGATKLVSLSVINAKNKKSAFEIAKTVATSNLVKTAFYGNDANWGRILAAAGRANAQLDPENITLTINGFKIYHKGRLPKVDVEKLNESMIKHDQIVVLDCGYNTGIEDRYYFSDLSHEYISVNSAYRT